MGVPAGEDKRGAVLEATGSFGSRTEEQAAAVVQLLHYSNLYLKTQYSGPDSLFKRLRGTFYLFIHIFICFTFLFYCCYFLVLHSANSFLCVITI